MNGREESERKSSKFYSAVLERSGSFRFTAKHSIEITSGDYVLLSRSLFSSESFIGQVDKMSFGIFPETITYPKTDAGAVFSGKVFAADEKKETKEETTVVPTGYYTGSGNILAEIKYCNGTIVETNLQFDLDNCVGDVLMELAPSDAIGCYFTAAYSNIDPNKNPLFSIGTLLNAKKPIRVKLIADGFKRHTGLFGQSGSGKSFALGILLEELHLNARVNIVVLDLNGDFIRFKEPLRKVEEINDKKSNKYMIEQEEIRRHEERHSERRDSIKILSVDPSENTERLVIRLSDLDARQQSLLFKLDPIRDKEEYLILSKSAQSLTEERECYEIRDLEMLINSHRTATEGEKQVYDRLYARIKNLRLEQLLIWGESGEDSTPSVTLLSREELKTVIIDLSNLSRIERSIVSTIVFSKLWDKQIERKLSNIKKPSFLVIDEAHNLFPATPLFPDQELTLDWGIRVAGEGRKFGLYLLISSQLPSKVHEHVLTQCGNVILMKMINQSDIGTLQDAFSFVPETLLQRSNSFQIGEALVIGNIIPSPCLVHFEGRKTQESGKDFEVEWT